MLEDDTQYLVVRFRIQELLEESNMSYFRLANELGTCQSAIASWVSGTRMPHLKYIYRLAKYFNVSADYIIGITDER